MVKFNRIIDSESYTPWETGNQKDGNFTGDPFFKKGS